MTHRIYTMPFASVYPHYVAKLQKKGRTEEELVHIVEWLTGYSGAQLKNVISKQINFEDFFADAPKLNSKRKMITGTICGVRVEEIQDPLMQNIRYLDKLVDELAKGKALEKVLRTAS